MQHNYWHHLLYIFLKQVSSLPSLPSLNELFFGSFNFSSNNNYQMPLSQLPELCITFGFQFFETSNCWTNLLYQFKALMSCCSCVSGYIWVYFPPIRINFFCKLLVRLHVGLLYFDCKFSIISSSSPSHLHFPVMKTTNWQQIILIFIRNFN